MAAFIILIVFLIYVSNSSKNLKNLRNQNQSLKKFILKVIENSNVTNEEKEQMKLELLKIEKSNDNIELSQARENIARYEAQKAREKMNRQNNIKPNQNEAACEIQENSQTELSYQIDKNYQNKINYQSEIRIEDKIEKEKREREKKNTTILITGSILIVLAAIVFFMSTWYTIPNILKTIVLLLLIFVFLGGSKIAKEKFNLEKASKTFFYIAMAYIPMCLFSISFLGLLGDYLSFTGEGNYIYLTIAGIITSIIYFVTYKIAKSKLVFYGSLLTQVFSVVLFSLMFSNNLELISLNLLLYNILFILVTRGKNIKLITDIKYIYSILPYFATFLIYLSLGNVNALIPITLIVLAVNYAILENIEKRKSHAYLLNITISVFGVYSIFNNQMLKTDDLKNICILVYLVVVYVIEDLLLTIKNRKELLSSATVVTLTLLQLQFLRIYSYESMILRPYIVSAIQCVMVFFAYKNSKELGKKITNVLFPIYFVITGITFFKDMDVSYHYYIIFSLLTLVLGEMSKDEKIKQGFFVVSHLYIVFTYLFTFIEFNKEFLNDVIYIALLLAVYVYSYFRNNNNIFKYCSYIVVHLVIYSVCELFRLPIEVVYLIPTLTLIGLINLEKKYVYLKDSGSDIFFVVLKIIAYMYLAVLGEELSAILTILLTVYLIYYNHKNKENIYYNIIPLIGVMPSIFGNSLNPVLQTCIMLMTTIAITVFSVQYRKINIYTIFSGMYLFFTLDELNIDYVKEILFIVWAVYNYYLMRNHKEKDIFKGLTYIGGICLYNLVISDLKLDVFRAFNMLGYIVFTILIMRNILKKYLKNTDSLEAIIFSIMYILALFNYKDEYDGMLFGIFLVGIIIYSYVKKYGTIFLTTVLFLLINMFLLTRAFWFSIPWWVYLLLVGSVLISFAIKNEANEKNERISIDSTLKKIKDKIEK